jgi:hypothetical protein
MQSLLLINRKAFEDLGVQDCVLVLQYICSDCVPLCILWNFE